METGDFGRGHGKGKAIAAAGREEVERGLNKFEGTHVRTSAVTDAPNGGGPHAHDGTLAGAAPVGDPNAPHASAAAPRADPSAGKGKARWDAPDTNGYSDKETGTGTASAAGGAVGGPGTDLRTNEQIAAPGARPARGARPAGAGTDDPNVQHDTGVESVTAPGDPRKQTRFSTNLPQSGEAGGPRSDQRTDEQFATHAPAARPADGPNVQHDTGVESRLAPGDTGKQARATTNLPLSGETAGRPEEQSSGTAAQVEQRSDRPTAVAGSG